MPTTTNNADAVARRRYRDAVLGFALAERLLPTYVRALTRQQSIRSDDLRFAAVEAAAVRRGFKYEVPA